MKIGTPELKVKPSTKCFDHGYYSFSTVNKELFYQVTLFNDERTPAKIFDKPRPVKDAEHLKQLLTTKTREQVWSIIA